MSTRRGPIRVLLNGGPWHGRTVTIHEGDRYVVSVGGVRTTYRPGAGRPSFWHFADQIWQASSVSRDSCGDLSDREIGAAGETRWGSS